MNPWIPHLLRAGGGGGGPVLPPAGRTMLANLKSSLILDEGTGDPTWSRATKAWGFNELGYLEELASGCAFFGGARLVRNTVRTTSEDFSNAAWIKFGSITAPSANIIVCANATSAQYINQGGTLSLIPGQKLSYCIRAKKVVGGVDFIQIAGQSTTHGTGQFVNISLVDGTYSATGCFPVVTSLGGGVYDISVVLTCVAAGFDVYNIVFTNALSSTRLEAFVGDGIKSFELLRAWSVDVTNYDASYVPEYVSVGVVASPYFGAGIDGAKYFNTGWNGAPLTLQGFRREAAATNNLLHCRDLTQSAWTQTGVSGAEIITNGAFAADTDWSKTAGWAIGSGQATCTANGSNQAISQASATAYVSGTEYVLSYTVVSNTLNAGTLRVGGYAGSSGFGISPTTLPSAVGAQSIALTASPTGTGVTLDLWVNGATTGALVIDNVSIKLAAVQPTKTATGLDGIANTATTLTAAAADAIILQPITLASAARCASAYVKRRTGTGTISFTQDGGSTWTDITSQINSSTWSRVQITSTLANPSVGFKISTSGDAIDVDCVQNEAGAVATSPIVTTTAAVTRNAESLTYQTAGNIDAALGTLFCEYSVYEETMAVPRAVIGLSTTAATANALLLHATGVATSSLSSGDGTTSFAKTGLGSAVNTKRKAAVSWGTGRSLTAKGLAPQAGAFSGTLPSTAIAPGAYTNGTFPLNGYIGPVAIYNYQMTDAELQAITT